MHKKFWESLPEAGIRRQSSKILNEIKTEYKNTGNQNLILLEPPRMPVGKYENEVLIKNAFNELFKAKGV